jgi:FkbM family methyltransferase
MIIYMVAAVPDLPGLFQPQSLLLHSVSKSATARSRLLAGTHEASVTPVSARAEGSEASRRAAHRLAEVAEDIDSLGLSQPVVRNCTLSFLQSRLWAFSFIPGDDATMLSHWLNHYVSGLGVPPTHVQFARLNRSSEDDNSRLAHERVMRTYGVPSTQLTVAPSTQYSDALRLAAVNAWITRLPADAWVIFADSDELFSFPCTMATLVAQGHTRFCAQMVDRLSASGAIEPLRAHPDISVQYPRECHLRHLLSEDSNRGTFYTSKVALFKVRLNDAASSAPRTFRSPHNLHGSTAVGCVGGPILAHYTLTAVARVLAEHKANWEREANLKDHRSASTASSRKIACTLHDAHGGCRDYAAILAFIAAQEKHPNRSVAPLCMTSLVGSTGSRYAAPALHNTTSDTSEAHMHAAKEASEPKSEPATGSDEASPTDARRGLVRRAIANRSLLEGCRHLYLDLGANTGMVLRSLYNPESAPHASLQPLFNHHFGRDGATRLRTVCAVGFEPNPRHTSTLASIEDKFGAMGARLTALTTTAASVADGSVNFYPHADGPKAAPGWASSLYEVPGHQQAVSVESVDLALWLLHQLPRDPPPVTIVKMDVEGEEYRLLSKLLALGVLCQLSFVLVEYHGNNPFVGKSTFEGKSMSAGFPETLGYMLRVARERGQRCNVSMLPLNDAKNG